MDPLAVRHPPWPMDGAGICEKPIGNGMSADVEETIGSMRGRNLPQPYGEQPSDPNPRTPQHLYNHPNNPFRHHVVLVDAEALRRIRPLSTITQYDQPPLTTIWLVTEVRTHCVKAPIPHPPPGISGNAAQLVSEGS